MANVSTRVMRWPPSIVSQLTPTHTLSFSLLILHFLFRYFTGNNLNSNTCQWLLLSCPSRSIHYKRSMLCMDFTKTFWLHIYLFFTIFFSPIPPSPLSPPLSSLLQFLGAFREPLSSIKTPGNKRKSLGEFYCFILLALMWNVGKSLCICAAALLDL